MSSVMSIPKGDDPETRRKRDLIAQWAFDTRPLLLRFHLKLEDVEVRWPRGVRSAEFTRELSFLDGGLERLVAMTGAVTALGTRLFGRFGEGAGCAREELNRVKKDADAISAYAMSESLWYLSRQLPENHAILVCLGEGLMAKGGETPEMGSNPQLGFGRVYARPRVARWLDNRVLRLLNEPGYGWESFYRDIRRAGITVWGVAVDTLENTSRFAVGAETGPLTVLHLFDQPMVITRPYEGYFGNLLLPSAVVERAAERSLLVDFRTPRARVLEAILATYPELRPQNVHVWTLSGRTREPRIGKLWQEWSALGVHLIEDGWQLPAGGEAFTDSGTYAPVHSVGTWHDEGGELHLLLCDGYAASAEAVQAATLAETREIDASMAILTSSFELAHDQEVGIMRLDPRSPEFVSELAGRLGAPPDESEAMRYAGMIQEAHDANLPLESATVRAADFFPEKRWQTLAVAGYMNYDPYTGAPGVSEVEPGVFSASVRLSSALGDKLITFKLRLVEGMKHSRLIFNPLLVRFFQGEDFRARPVRISDSGRIRNELQTLCSEALEHRRDGRIRIDFEKIAPEVIGPEERVLLAEILRWYKAHHPVWFKWLELA